MSPTPAPQNSVAQQKANGEGGRFGFLSHGEQGFSLGSQAHTKLSDLPPLIVSVRLEKWDGDDAVEVGEDSFDARTLLAGRSVQEIQSIIEESGDGYDGDWLYEEACDAGLVDRWDGPYECDTWTMAEDLEANPDLVKTYGEASLDPNADFTLIDGLLVDRSEMIADGTLDADGTVWKKADGKYQTEIHGHRAEINFSKDDKDYGQDVYLFTVSDSEGPYLKDGVALTLDGSKRYVKDNVAEARDAGPAPYMVGRIHAVHGEVKSQSRLFPGATVFSMHDGTSGLALSPSMLRRLPEDQRGENGIYVGREAQKITNELSRFEADGRGVYTNLFNQR